MKSSINVQYNVYAPKAERNHATHLNHITRTVYLLGSQFKLPCGASSLERMRFLGHVNTNGTFPLHGMARYGSVRFTFGGVFQWVLYLVPGTFLVPPRPGFQAIRTVTKT